MISMQGGQSGPAELQLRAAMEAHGLTPPKSPELDGRIHRCPGVGGGKRDDSGWWVAYSDNGVPAGSFGCWRTGLTEHWAANIGRELTAQERATQQVAYALAREAREKARAATHEAAAAEVRAVWADTMPCSPEHEYMSRKGLKEHPTARVMRDGRLVVPLYGAHDEGLTSLQYIAGDGQKRYHTGGKVVASHCWLGWDDKGAVYVAEGYATALTIHQATGRPAVAAFSAGNLLPVVAWLRESLGAGRELVIVADLDKNGTGQHYADQAGAKYGCRVVLSPTPTDLNDHMLAGGDIWSVLEPRQEYLERLPKVIEPIKAEWLIKKWLPKNALVMVHGPPASFKSFLVLDWCCEISRVSPILNLSGNGEDHDRQWNGHKVRQGTVAYLAGEGKNGIRMRVAAWRQERGCDDMDFYLSKDGCDLNTPKGYQVVADSLRALKNKPALVVVDTLHRFMAGDENSAQDSKGMIDNCQRLIDEFGCALILVHHTPKTAPTQARGSSSWKGALDVEINISGEGGVKKVQHLKMKDVEEYQSVNVCLKNVPLIGWLDEDGEQVSSAVIRSTEEVEKKQENPKARRSKDEMLSEHRRTFETCWKESGRETFNDSPFVSRAALKAIIEKNLGSPAAKAAFRDDQPGRMLIYMCNNDLLRPEGTGFVVKDSGWASVMMLKGSNK
jgi:putative DNA primase/helicase